MSVYGKIRAAAQMRAKVPLDGRTAIGHAEGLLHMELAGLAVGTQPSVIVDPVGDVGILLDLRDDQSGADGMEGSGLNKKHVPGLYGHTVQNLLQRPVLDPAGKLLPADLPFKTIV